MLAWYCCYVPYVVGHLIHQMLDLKLKFFFFILSVSTSYIALQYLRCLNLMSFFHFALNNVALFGLAGISLPISQQLICLLVLNPACWVLYRKGVTAKKMPVLVRGKSLTNLLIFCKGPSEKTELRRTKDMNGRFSFSRQRCMLHIPKNIPKIFGHWILGTEYLCKM